MTSNSNWSNLPPRPATLLVPRDEKPAPEDIRDALAELTGPLAIEAVPAHVDQVAWAAAFRHETWAVPLFAWLEPSGEDAPAWILCVQGLLDPEDPILAYEGLTRLVAAAVPDAPHVIDGDTGLTLDVAELRDDDAWPGLAWIVRTAHDGTQAWIHTRGLRRLGCPELEMLAVPIAHAEAAMQVLNTIADLLVDGPIPEPDEPWAIGPDVAVRMRPWADAVGGLPAGTPGIGDDEDGLESEERAVVGDAMAPFSTWPANAVTHAEAGTAALYTTARESQGRAAQARGRWPEFVDAFSAWQASDEVTRDPLHFHVKAAFESPDADDVQREHLWFAIESIDGEFLTGRLLNTPHLATRLEADTTYRLSRDQVSDWQVVRGEA